MEQIIGVPSDDQLSYVNGVSHYTHSKYDMHMYMVLSGLSVQYTVLLLLIFKGAHCYVYTSQAYRESKKEVISIQPYGT